MTPPVTNRPLSIRPVNDPAALRQFIRVPHYVYRDDPQWIAPLDFQEKHRFSPKRPFFEHARWQAWVALRDGRPLGRISAQVDDLHQQRYGDQTGFFGMIEAVDDAEVFTLLFDTAQAWLAEQGMRRARGPFNLTINEELGVLVDGFKQPPSILMGHGCPWYDARIKAAGYRGIKDLLAFMINPDFTAPAVMRKLARRASRDVTVRSMRRGRLAEDTEIMREIFNDAWRDNWGFVPFTENEFTDLVKTLALLLPEDYVQIAEYRGRPAAFIVMLPNLNEAIRGLRGRLFPGGLIRLLWRLKVRGLRSGRVPLMGVRHEFQHSPLGPVMAFMVIDAVRKCAVRRGMVATEMGWVLEDNQAMRNIIETIGGEACKRYRIYEKELD